MHSDNPRGDSLPGISYERRGRLGAGLDASRNNHAEGTDVFSYLAGVRVPRHFGVSIVAPVFDLKPLHRLVIPSRPIRLRKQRYPRLPTGLTASPLLAFALTHLL